jgi:hypothetical protein
MIRYLTNIQTHRSHLLCKLPDTDVCFFKNTFQRRDNTFLTVMADDQFVKSYHVLYYLESKNIHLIVYLVLAPIFGQPF